MIRLLFFHRVVGTREGTVLAALLTGQVVKFFVKRVRKPVEKLLMNQHAVPKDQPLPQGERGKLITQHISHRRDRRDPQLSVLCHRHAQSGKEEADNKEDITFCKVMGGPLRRSKSM